MCRIKGQDKLARSVIDWKCCCNFPSMIESFDFKNFFLLLKMPKVIAGYDPCLDDYARSYYNRRDVQKALHVGDGTSLTNWTICKYVTSLAFRDSRDESEFI